MENEVKETQVAQKAIAEKIEYNVTYNGEILKAYFSKPNRQVSLAALDKAASLGTMAAGELIVSCCLLPESDPRLTSENEEFDTLYLGLVLFASNLVKIRLGELKKN